MDRKTQLAKVKYRDYLREYKNLIRAAKRNYYGALISTYKNNIKKVWEIVRGAVGIVKNRQGKFPEYFLCENKSDLKVKVADIACVWLHAEHPGHLVTLLASQVVVKVEYCLLPVGVPDM